MASAGLREELECSICLNLYTDPVTLRCGHNFCRVCIDQVLNTQEASGVYSCPECRGKFQERPALQKNITLCNVVENFLSTHQDEAVIFCTYCVDSPVPAVKSCLMCEASLCDKHLKVHIKGGEHVLTEPRTSLENRKCPIHKKILEYYCTEDAACICVSCCLIGEHSGHKMESLDEASKNKKKKLRNVLQKLITKRKKREERVRSLEERRRKAQEKASGEAKRVTALFIDMRRQMDDLEKRILSEISKQEEKMSRSLSDVIHQLEIKKDELSRKMRHIEELCNMADPLTVLQGPDPGDLCDPEEEGGDENTGRHDGGDRGLELLLHTLSDMIRDVNVTFYLQDPVDILLDVNTANNNIRISDDLKTASRTDITKNCLKIIKACHMIPKSKPSPLTFGSHSFFQMNKGFGFKNFPEENKGFVFKNCPEENKGCGFKICPKDNKGFGFQNFPEENKGFGFQNFPEVNKGFGFQNVPQVADSSRFKTHPQVMSNKNFSSGRHYWDVEISGAGRWRVGMCYPSIDRSGDQSYIGNNNKSWALCRETLNNNQYLVIHDSKWIQLPHQISSNRVRICLDYEARQLSFYELCDPIRRLHTFTTTFTEPLHAALCVNKGLQK